MPWDQLRVTQRQKKNGHAKSQLEMNILKIKEMAKQKEDWLN